VTVEDMEGPAPQDLTQLLVAWSNGDQGARDSLIPLVYDELRRLARNYMNRTREKPGNPLQTIALVNEAYLRLAQNTQIG
jgi:RNA polymerase sigma-70 factor (ECF subfamily)